jgi:hypothetical protein
MPFEKNGCFQGKAFPQEEHVLCPNVYYAKGNKIGISITYEELLEVTPIRLWATDKINASRTKFGALG